jgi:predicted DNA-binding protein
MGTQSPTEPRQGQRRTTLSLTPELWEQLKAIEEKTGARPSVTVRRLLERSLRKAKPGAPPPAA